MAGRGEPTVVFEAGGGDDSSVWATIEPEVRRNNHVRTFLYDRAGLGKSDPPPAGEYRIHDEAEAFVQALDARRIRGPIVLVAHSYGGFVATLFAAADPRASPGSSTSRSSSVCSRPIPRNSTSSKPGLRSLRRR